MAKTKGLQPHLSPGSLSSLRALTRKVVPKLQERPYQYREWLTVFWRGNKWSFKPYKPTNEQGWNYIGLNSTEIVLCDLNRWQTPKQLEKWILKILDHRTNALNRG